MLGEPWKNSARDGMEATNSIGEHSQGLARLLADEIQRDSAENNGALTESLT